MKIFYCDHCGNLLFFENVSCLRCNHAVGFIPELLDLATLAPRQNLWQPVVPNAVASAFRQCQNGAMHAVCNWLVPESDPSPLCRACRLNLVIPDLTVIGNVDHWRKLEIAKRRVIYALLRLGLSTEHEANTQPLRFRFLADSPGEAALTGHKQGVITINLAEADDAERERRRAQFHEPMRTLLGHFRHEIAHYYWDRLIAPNSSRIEAFRQLFGDERQDYSSGLNRHYQQGPPADWSCSFVSAYASSHPWEDWAETWAHYLHITDTLETTAAFGLSLRPKHPQAATMSTDPAKISPRRSEFDQLIENWIPLTHALNELNRGMGHSDHYPFVLGPAALEKLRFIHNLLQGGRVDLAR